MTIEDWLAETVIPLSAAPKEFPNRPHQSTVWRWATTGCRGHVLATFTLGGRVHTSKQACLRFLAALNGGRRHGAARTAGSDTRAERELKRLGL